MEYGKSMFWPPVPIILPLRYQKRMRNSQEYRYNPGFMPKTRAKASYEGFPDFIYIVFKHIIFYYFYSPGNGFGGPGGGFSGSRNSGKPLLLLLLEKPPPGPPKSLSGL